MSNVEVDWDVCIGSGNCVHFLPDVFQLTEDGLSTVVDSDAATFEELREVAEQCPTGAITVEE